jgi:hypothetical protein
MDVGAEASFFGILKNVNFNKVASKKWQGYRYIEPLLKAFKDTYERWSSNYD